MTLIEDAYRIFNQGLEEHDPVAVFLLTSGGNDSIVPLHLFKDHPRVTAAMHIDTSIRVPQVEDHVKAVCEQFGLKLLIYRAAENTKADGTPDPMVFEDIVKQHGFPGPAQHRIMYSKLKQRQVRRLVRDFKTEWNDRIMLVTGVRKHESRRRMGTVEEIQRDGAQVWVAPVTNWTNEDMLVYREYHGLPVNPVSKALGMSGECLCLAPDSLISTPSGWRPIKDVNEGDLVHTQQYGGVAERPVAVKHVNDPKPMLRVKPYFLPAMEMTENHPLWARPYRFVGHDLTKTIEDPTWINAGDVAAAHWANKGKSPSLLRKHYIGRPFRTDERPTGLTEAQLTLLGYFVSEGAYQHKRDERSGIVFTISAKSLDMGRRISDAMTEALGRKPAWRTYTDKRTGREFIMIRDGRREVSDWVGQWIIGRYCWEKQLSDVLVTAPLSEQEVLLRAAWDGDGSDFVRSGTGERVRAYGTSSRGLALQVQEMLLRTGEVYGIGSGTSSSGRPTYLVRRNVNGSTRNGVLEDGVLWCAVQSIEEADEQETHNFTIAGQPNYLTEAGLVHNCGAYAKPGELARLERCYPETAEYIKKIERESGCPWRWEEAPPRRLSDDVGHPEEFQPLCTSCNAKGRAA